MKLRRVESLVKDVEKNATEVFEEINLRDNSIARLLQMSKDIQEKCEDFTVYNANNETVRFTEQGGLSFISDNEIHSALLTPFAMSQLGTKLGIPIRYLDKCMNTGRNELAQDNVNSWLEDYNKDLFIRMYDNRIRGLLSTRYSVCDTNELLEAIDDKVNFDSLNIKGSYISPERFHLRCAFKDRIFADDDLFAGFVLDSSDVGRSTLQMRFLIFKQVCTNGLIVAKNSAELFKQKHIGITSEEFAKGFEESLDLIPEISMDIKEQIERTKNVDFAKDKKSLESTIEKLRVNTKFSPNQIEKVLEVMNTTYEPTQWGYINAITQVAQSLSLERRLEVETYAGSLLVA